MRTRPDVNYRFPDSRHFSCQIVMSSTDLPAKDIPLPTKINQPVRYPLPYNEEERQRQELQHYLLLRTLGNVQVHAPVDLSEPETPVLESGTGSGIWLTHLAKSVPRSTVLTGIDVESNLFPPPSTLPPNLTFQANSILSLPTEWTNKFLLVHQRFLFGSLRCAEWITAISNIHHVLKPGGWFQLFELEEWVNVGPVLQSYSHLLKTMLEALGIEGMFPNGSKRWSSMLEKAGFVDIRVSWHDTPVGKWAGGDGVDMKSNLIALSKGFSAVVLEHGGFGVVSGGEEGYKKWVEDLEKEVDEGATEPKSRWVMICARKPNLDSEIV